LDVQESNVGERRMALYPSSEDWTDARRAAGVVTSNHEDMHGGEAETSILLAASPEVVRSSYRDETSQQMNAATCSRWAYVATRRQV
jgi:creatinine amidohydrolase